MALPPYSKPMRPKPRRRNSGSLAVPGIAALVAIGIFAIMGFAYTALRRHDQDPHKFTVHRRILHAESAGGEVAGSGQLQGDIGTAVVGEESEQPVLLPGFRHTLAVLTAKGASGKPAWSNKELQAVVEDVIAPVVISRYSPAESATLASFFGATSLPAIAYMKPHCLPATCGNPPVLALATRAGAGALGVNATRLSGPPTSVQEVASWIKRTATRPAILLANDHPSMTVRYRHVVDPLLPDQGKPLGQFDIPPHGRQWIETPLGANWVATDSAAPAVNPPAPFFTVKVKGDTHLLMRGPECNLITEKDCRLPLPHLNIDDNTAKARQRNWDRLKSDIISQKKTTPIFTKNGFEKTRAPPMLYAMLKDFWEQHNRTASNENWTPDNIYVNHDASRFQLVELPEIGTAKSTMFEMIRPTFEKWAGVAPQLPSAIYGVRVYTEGSVLQDHVDRSDTHIISAIINVAQDLDEPWPLEIVGHSMQPAHVVMEPGDMILYEGASCAHGRPTPLKGRFMANVFLHMRPTPEAVAALKASGR
eukprot:CAMPEP_0206137300 /NCGR_PEP_ID=MMETSP1473-20131121/2453_1 /ASSEMBLY_ACC=CAM_ASM_001109 /TAXON_ID=1461547 /ORGANISM="Stichococcus sp, Strain RCC1054" /LENGTH=534 /DNA_ID=CAMNT_0053530323 /DNA_START=367 /DNA_END=1971 /DNA_ORIENTATION=+